MTANVGTVARLERGLPRDVLARVAVVVTLAGAVAAAHQGSNSALSIAVASLTGQATDSTAERHVANILNKLGLRSRTEVALWAAERGLPD
jgi:hypothetical protein